MSVDLRSSYLGLGLRSPLVASPSPLTGELDGLRRLEGAGVGAVVLPSLFEEQLTHDQLELDRLLETTADHTGDGPERVQRVEAELRAVMAEHEHDSVAQLGGSMSRSAMADPAGFERANYLRTLMSWSSRAQVSPGQATSDKPVP
jgi:hypothetical protein